MGTNYVGTYRIQASDLIKLDRDYFDYHVLLELGEYLQKIVGSKVSSVGEICLTNLPKKVK
jgi:hypothetical protein